MIQNNDFWTGVIGNLVADVIVVLFVWFIYFKLPKHSTKMSSGVSVDKFNNERRHLTLRIVNNNKADLVVHCVAWRNIDRSYGVSRCCWLINRISPERSNHIWNWNWDGESRIELKSGEIVEARIDYDTIEAMNKSIQLERKRGDNNFGNLPAHLNCIDQRFWFLEVLTSDGSYMVVEDYIRTGYLADCNSQVAILFAWTRVWTEYYIRKLKQQWSRWS